MAAKRHPLPIETRAEVIELSKAGKSERQIALQVGSSKGQVGRILRDQRDKIENLKDVQGNIPNNLKRRKLVDIAPKYCEIENACVLFLERAKEHGIPVTGPMLRTLALREAENCNIQGFSASEGWLDRVKRRHGIHGRHLSGEAASANKVVVMNWMEQIPELIEGYDPKNIFNCDETGLYYKQTTSLSLVMPGDACHGGKAQKERLTLLICCSWMGEKVKPLIIGKSTRPRCLRSVDLENMSISYKSQKSSWMNGDIFSWWINEFESLMYQAGRKVLLFMDNATVHNIVEQMEFRAVKVVFFPKNTTCSTQPCDAGIIQTVKLLYRKQLHNFILSALTHECGKVDPYKEINLARVIVWLFRAWRDLKPATIVKCFSHCGFSKAGDIVEPQQTPLLETEAETLLSAEEEQMEIFPPVVEPEELFDKVVTELKDQLEEVSIQAIAPTEIITTEDDVAEIPNNKQVLQALETIELYAAGRGDDEVLGGGFNLAWYRQIIEERAHMEATQTTIEDFFKKTSL
ncbi:Tigger transposable element-derived protein 6 [Oopsacas minuta]|uniref:Tigger transposable element-derived protein 6 n=1 Tax=Oopsacas minuta TaxID=111878 RepID=A0AAV7KC54_9METZ|nr:Tigger transposable element-derived protein 6 [Oopsacas minuta]